MIGSSEPISECHCHNKAVPHQWGDVCYIPKKNYYITFFIHTDLSMLYNKLL